MLPTSSLLNLCYTSHNDKSILTGETMPKISAVMALYNTSYDLLDATITSILNQSYKDFELIIIDDDSKIDYTEFLKKFQDSRLKYFKLAQNHGPGYARNEGIKKATGEYIAICDSDDIYLENRFEKQSEFLDKNKEISLLGCNFKLSNSKRKIEVIENNEDIKIFMLFNSPLANPSVMFRREVFIDNNLFYPTDINFAEDYLLWIQAMFKGIKMANLKDVLMIYTRRKNQLSKTKIDEQAKILKTIYSKIFSELKINAQEKDVELHYAINSSKYKEINTEEEIEIWFDKIIEKNLDTKIFDEKKLIARKPLAIEDYKKNKNRFIKIKVGKVNLCLDKKLKFFVEERL